ncbi:MAG: hypothetical protein ACK4JD_12565 [Thermoflexales bacterium]
MTTLRRLLVVLVVIGLAAGAVYAVEQALRPQLLVLLDNGERRGEAAEARGEHEDDEHGEAEHTRPRRGAGEGRGRQRAEGPSPLNEHFEPLEGLAGLGGDVLLVGAVGGAVVGVDYAAARLRKPWRK